MAAAAVYGPAPSLRAEGDADADVAHVRAQAAAGQGLVADNADLMDGIGDSAKAAAEPVQVARLPAAEDITHMRARNAALTAMHPETPVVEPAVTAAAPADLSGREVAGPPTAKDAAWIAAWERDAEGSVHLALLSSEGVRAASRTKASRHLVVKSGDTMMRLMERATIPRRQAVKAIRAMRKLYDPRRILPGQKLTINYTASDADLADRGYLLRRVHLTTAVDRAVAVERKAKGRYRARVIRTPLKVRLGRAAGTIRSSLYLAAQAIRLPNPVLVQLIRVYSWDVDFQRDLRPGDTFEVAWQKYYTPDGRFVRHGKMVFGSMTLSGKTRPLYRFTAHNGTGYFDAKGEGARKPLMRTPIDGARLSSGYGRRRHPFLGYTLMHRGVDFAGRPGTPVLAAGDGRITYAGRNGAYGKYIRIRHNGRYQTAYAHLKSIRRGIRPGKLVRQGQVIGSLGSTGRSTGPHLHYEIQVDGRQVNPMRVKMPSRRVLRGRDLAAFRSFRGALDRQIAGLIKGQPAKITRLSRR